MTESLLLSKLHSALILKDQSFIAPHLADDLVIEGAKPYIASGNSDKEQFLNLLSSVQDCSLYSFKSSFAEFNLENRIINGLYVEYHVEDECWAKLEVHIENIQELISKLVMTIRECDEYFWGTNDEPTTELPQEEKLKKIFMKFCYNPGE